MRGVRSTGILLVIFLGLIGYIYFVESEQPAAESGPMAFEVEAGDIQELRITSAEGETSVLQKAEDSWQLVEPVTAAADESEASSITTSLSSLEIARVVDENATDLATFGLADPRMTVAFSTAGEGELRQLHLGDKTATGGDLYARIEGENRVFLIAAYLENTFNRTPFDLREKSILAFERTGVDRMEIETADADVTLERREGEWYLAEPWKARADFNAVDGIVSRLNTSQMRAIAADDPEDLAEYGLKDPRVTATVGAGSARATLQVGTETDEGTVYARDASRDMVFTIDAALVDDLTRAPVEYRRKDLFDFRPFNATRFDVTRDGRTLVFEKRAGSGENAAETWHQVEPESREVDRTAMDDVLSKFSLLRADTWVESRDGTGLGSPVATVVVRFEDGEKEERVVFGRDGEDAYAAVGDEPGAARFSGSSLDEALKALEGLTTPTT